MCKDFSHFSFRSMTVFGLKKMSDLDVLITCLETPEYQSSFSTKMYIIAGAFLAILMPQKVFDSSPSRTTRETFLQRMKRKGDRGSPCLIPLLLLHWQLPIAADPPCFDGCVEKWAAIAWNSNCTPWSSVSLNLWACNILSTSSASKDHWSLSLPIILYFVHSLKTCLYRHCIHCFAPLSILRTKPARRGFNGSTWTLMFLWADPRPRPKAPPSKKNNFREKGPPPLSKPKIL